MSQQRIFKCVILIAFLMSYKAVLAQDQASILTSAGSTPLIADITGDVNLFTGDFETEVSLYTLTSRNGLSFPIRLAYDSDVNETAGADNNIKQASAQGLGWQLVIPYISTKITALSPGNLSYSDSYVEGNETNPLIYIGSNQSKLQDYRFWKITYISNTQGWEIITEDGTKLKFGHRRYLVFRFYYSGSYILLDPPNPPAQFIDYRWDLSEIEDVFGNKISFQYDDVTENVSDWQNFANPNVRSNYANYIKASYLKKIIDNATGKVVKLNWGVRTDYEDGWNGYNGLTDSPPNSDSYEEFFSTQRLESLKVYDKDPDVTAQVFHDIGFQYDYRTYGNDAKLMLTAINRYDPTNSTAKLPSLAFDYHPYVTPYNNPGGLKQITYPDGGEKMVYYENTACNSEWRIDYITVNDKMGNSYQTNFTWGNAVSLSNGAYCGHPWVEVDLPGSYGKTKYTFEVVESTHLAGALKKTEHFKEGSSTINQTMTNTWVADDKSGGSYFKKLTQVDNQLDGVTTTVQYAYNGSNGLVQEMTETNTNGSVRVVKTTYAFEIAAYFGATGMDTKHMFSQIAQQTVYLTASNNSANARSSTVTTWKQWPANSGKWAPEATYNWLEDDASYGLPAFNFTSPPGDVEWVKTSKALSRDSYGNAQEIEDAYTTKMTTQWGYSSSLPIATISNAKSSETSMVNFEDGTYGDWNDWGGANGVSSNVFYSGEKGWYQDGVSYKVLARNFDDTELSNKSGKYTVSGWVKTSSTAPNLLWFVVYNGGAQAYPASRAAAGSGQWEYLESTVDLSPYANIDYIQVYARNGDGTIQVFAPCYWDDLRFYSDSSLVSTIVYDPKTFALTAQADPNGTTAFQHYDSFNRSLGSSNTEGKLLNSTLQYYSRDGNAGVFNGSDPNYARQIVSQSDGLISDFRGQAAAEWTVSTGTWAVANGEYNQSNTTEVNTNSYRSYSQAGRQYYRWKVTFNSSSAMAGMHIMASSGTLYNRGNSYLIWQSSTVIRLYESINDVLYTQWNFNFTAQSGETHIYEVLYDNGRLDIWRDGKYVGNWIDGTPLTTGAYISLRTNSTAADFDDVIAQGDPAITVTFTDGLGREIQRQTWNSANDIIAKTTYNSIALVEKQYKPQEISNPNHAYYPSLTGVYELFEYFDDPLGRLQKQTHMGGGSWITYEYGSEGFNTDPNTYTFSYVKVTDEETPAKIAKNYYDKFGRHVGGLDAVGTVDEIKFVNDYDILDNITRIKTPNYLTAVAADKPYWRLQNDYNTLNQRMKSFTPDEHTTRFVYDNNGNLRYSQDSTQVGSGDFTVYYYDKHNRVIKVGVETDNAAPNGYNWTSTAPPPDITNTTYGTEDDEWKVQNYYDVNYVTGMTNYSQGRLTKAEVNDDADNAAEHATLYLYDKFGNMTEKRISIDGGSPITEKTIRHGYDLLGRETQLTYPSGNVIARQFDAVGRLKKILTTN